MAKHEYRLEALGWADWLGQDETLVSYEFLGRRYVRVQPEILDAVKAMEMALRANGYEDPCDYTGSYFYRLIGGTDTWSSHAYGLALDVDYGYAEADRLVDKNPYLGFRPTREQYGVLFQFTWADVQAVKAIKNIWGEPMWLWLGDTSLGDTMHWQINVAPDRTEVDWTTVLGYEPEEGDDELTITELVTDATWRALWNGGHIDGDPRVMPDYYFADGPASDAEKINGYNVAIQSFIAKLDDVADAELVDQVNALEASLDDTQEKLRSV